MTLDVPLTGFPIARFGGVPLGLLAFGTVLLVLGVVLMCVGTRSTALRLLFLGGGVERRRHRRPGRSASNRPTSACPARRWRFRRRVPVQRRVLVDDRPHPRDLPGPQPARRAPTRRRGRFYAAPLLALVALTAIAYLAGGTTLDRVDRLGRRHGHSWRPGCSSRSSPRRSPATAGRPASAAGRSAGSRRRSLFAAVRDARPADAADRRSPASRSWPGARSRSSSCRSRSPCRRGRPGPAVPGRPPLAQPRADRRGPRGGAAPAPPRAARRARRRRWPASGSSWTWRARARTTTRRRPRR